MPSPYLVQSIIHALDAMEQLGTDAAPLSLTEMSHRLGMSKSTVYQLLATLESRGFVERVPGNGHYRLGLRVFQLGCRRLEQMGLNETAMPFLVDLRDQSGETVHLGVLQGQEILYVAKVESEQTIRMSSRIGHTAPLHCTGIGKAILAYQPTVFVEVLLARPLDRYTSRTITDPGALQRELALTRQRGYSLDQEEHETHVRCVGAPLWDHTGTVAAAISVSGPAMRMTEEVMQRLVPLVKETTMGVSDRLGYRK